jgi:hypothetical protein
MVIKKNIQFLVWLVIFSFFATGVSLYVSWYFEKFFSYAPSHYEPKDVDRQKLFDETGKSVSDD